MRINPRELRSDYYRNWGNARRLFLVTAALSNHTLDRRSTLTWGLRTPPDVQYVGTANSWRNSGIFQSDECLLTKRRYSACK